MGEYDDKDVDMLLLGIILHPPTTFLTLDLLLLCRDLRRDLTRLRFPPMIFTSLSAGWTTATDLSPAYSDPSTRSDKSVGVSLASSLGGDSTYSSVTPRGATIRCTAGGPTLDVSFCFSSLVCFFCTLLPPPKSR